MLSRRVCWLLCAILGCSSGDKINPRPLEATSATQRTPALLDVPTPAPAASSAKRPTPAPDAPFVHRPSDRSDHPIDACTQVGGNYFSCASAYEREQDPIIKRYLHRISRGFAAGVNSNKGSGEPLSPEESMPHAEVPAMCDLEKRCGEKDGGQEYNGPVNCLARAYEERLEHREKEAKAAHALACRCAGEAHFIGYNHSAEICDEEGKPAFLAPDLAAEEAEDIVACGVCDAERGPPACEREIARLTESDAELAGFIATRHVPRCRTPDSDR